MSGHNHVVQPAVYIKTLFLLMFFMVATIVAAKWDAMHFGVVWNLLIALAIAGAKVYFIMTNFMHVKHGSPLVKVIALLGFCFLIIMFTLTFNDYTTRTWHSPLKIELDQKAAEQAASGVAAHTAGAAH
jgi:cytochrome c oxidase subunit 4